MLGIYDLHKMKKVEDTISSFNAIIGEKNLLSIYFRGRIGELYTKSTDVQCLNPIVYKENIHKTKEIFEKYVTFTFHQEVLKV